jgi:mono/diheme cytochrome c family protein
MCKHNTASDLTVISRPFVNIRVLKLPAPQPLKEWAIGTLVGIFAIACIITGYFYFQTHDPYITEVLAHPGDSTLGHAIFQTNCSGCHGIDARGKVGPSLYQVSHRKSTASLIQQVTSGKTPPMPQFKPSPQEMADLLSYLQSL